MSTVARVTRHAINPGVVGPDLVDVALHSQQAEHGAELRTRDQRAAVTYDALSVPYRFVAS